MTTELEVKLADLRQRSASRIQNRGWGTSIDLALLQEAEADLASVISIAEKESRRADCAETALAIDKRTPDALILTAEKVSAELEREQALTAALALRSMLEQVEPTQGWWDRVQPARVRLLLETEWLEAYR